MIFVPPLGGQSSQVAQVLSLAAAEAAALRLARAGPLALALLHDDCWSSEPTSKRPASAPAR
jgi:hypothetical protein